MTLSETKTDTMSRTVSALHNNVFAERRENERNLKTIQFQKKESGKSNTIK